MVEEGGRKERTYSAGGELVEEGEVGGLGGDEGGGQEGEEGEVGELHFCALV